MITFKIKMKIYQYSIIDIDIIIKIRQGIKWVNNTIDLDFMYNIVFFLSNIKQFALFFCSSKQPSLIIWKKGIGNLNLCVLNFDTNGFYLHDRDYFATLQKINTLKLF